MFKNRCGSNSGPSHFIPLFHFCFRVRMLGCLSMGVCCLWLVVLLVGAVSKICTNQWAQYLFDFMKAHVVIVIIFTSSYIYEYNYFRTAISYFVIHNSNGHLNISKFEQKSVNTSHDLRIQSVFYDEKDVFYVFISKTNNYVTFCVVNPHQFRV